MPDATSELSFDSSIPTESTLTVDDGGISALTPTSEGASELIAIADGLASLVPDALLFNTSFVDVKGPVDNTQPPLGDEELVWGASGFPVSGGSTVYITTIIDTDEAAVRVPMPAGTLAELRVACSVAPGSGKTFTYTVMRDGVATSLTAQISGSGVSATDSSHQVILTAGQTISIRVETSAGAAQAYHSFSLKLT